MDFMDNIIFFVIFIISLTLAGLFYRTHDGQLRKSLIYLFLALAWLGIMGTAGEWIVPCPLFFNLLAGMPLSVALLYVGRVALAYRNLPLPNLENSPTTSSSTQEIQ